MIYKKIIFKCNSNSSWFENASLSEVFTWKNAGRITDKAYLSFPGTAKEFQIICAHGNYKHIIPLNHLTATESGNIMLISSVRGYINGTFRDITFSFDINASGEICISLVTRDEAVISDYICTLLYR